MFTAEPWYYFVLVYKTFLSFYFKKSHKRLSLYRQAHIHQQQPFHSFYSYSSSSSMSSGQISTSPEFSHAWIKSFPYTSCLAVPLLEISGKSCWGYWVLNVEDRYASPWIQYPWSHNIISRRFWIAPFCILHIVWTFPFIYNWWYLVLQFFIEKQFRVKNAFKRYSYTFLLHFVIWYYSDRETILIVSCKHLNLLWY